MPTTYFQPVEVPDHLREQWLAMQSTLEALTAAADMLTAKLWTTARPVDGELVKLIRETGDLVAEAKKIVHVERT